MQEKRLVQLNINVAKIIGVHIGVDKEGNNRCVKLSGEVGQLLRKAMHTIT
jgi:hypothetical protein